MDNKPKRTGGVMAIGARRIRSDFRLEGARYRPSLLRAPSETNLRRARAQLAAIKERIAAGTFSFADEFPDFRDLTRLRGGGAPTTCGAVFDAFLAHCEARLAKNDFAPITLTTYRRVLNRFWLPKLGALPFLSVRYSTLARIADEHRLSKKTYNNSISVLRRAFKFGYGDHPDRHNPATALESARIRKKDRPAIDPFQFRKLRLSSPHSTGIGAKRKATTMSFDSSPVYDLPSRSPCASVMSIRPAGDSRSQRPVWRVCRKIRPRPARTGAFNCAHAHGGCCVVSSRCGTP